MITSFLERDAVSINPSYELNKVILKIYQYTCITLEPVVEDPSLANNFIMVVVKTY